MSLLVSESEAAQLPVLEISRLEVLRDVEGDDGRPFICEFVELFETDARQRIKELKDVVAAGDTSGLRKMAHTLKGSCRNLGAAAMADHCLKLEKCGDTCTVEEAGEIVGNIEEAFSVVMVEVEKLVPKS